MCHPFNGIIDQADTLGEAFEIADRYEQRIMPDGSLFCGTPYEVEVHDRMARRGRPSVWKRHNKNSTYCITLKVDYMSLDAVWLCIRNRPME